MTALILTDIQNDFLPGGALAVSTGNEILPVVNRIIEYPFDLVVATKDWHPEGHCSFADTHGKNVGDIVEINGVKQILWPIHCLQNTPGSGYSPQLHQHKIQRIFYKGSEKQIDSYSAFYDNGHLRSTGLGEFLKEQGVDKVYIVGLTTEYCIAWSALDAKKFGFDTYVVKDACRPINLKPTDEQDAVQEMQNAGVHIIHSTQLV